jgi:hypothetical protein
MELAIPLVALGGLYLISNQKKTKEGYQTSSVNHYKTPNQVTDKYFIPTATEKESKMTFTDLAGREVNVGDYASKMTPYFGKMKNVGNTTSEFDNDKVMDHLNGGGTYHIAKSELAPLFKPQENVQWANGAPNQSSFYQSRVNPSNGMKNVKPWQEERVAPGLDQGFAGQGNSGFNSGMEARDKWTDRNVDELRVLTNPKQTFELTGHQGPAGTLVKNLGIEGKMEKHLPDKFYVNTPDRYLTTTGSEKGPTLRSEQPDPTVHRATTTQAYSGVASGGSHQQAKQGLYRMDHRQQFGSVAVNPASSNVPQSNLDQSIDSYKLLPNNRSTKQPESFGVMHGLVNAITAPIVDLVRPTRKEDLVGLTRLGGLGSTVSSAPATTNVVPPTVKEGTIYSPYSMGQRPFHSITDGGYQVNEHQPIQNQRDTTNTSYMGISSMFPQPTSNAAEYNATISSNRANEGRIAGGSMQTFIPIINQTTTSNRSTMHSSYMGGANGSTIASVPPSLERYGGVRNPNQYPEPDRNAPDLLDAFKQNPYTHSLHTAV